MHKLVVFLACLVAAASAQQHFYCSPGSPTSVSGSLTDFYLTTRLQNEAAYSAGLSCEFNAESPNRAYLVEIKSFKVGSAVLSISSGDQVLFSGSSIRAFESSLLTPTKSLKIRFDATGDQSGSEGVTVRVRSLDVNGCPPGWTYLYETCFGTIDGSSLTYFDAQRACNNMRSNLLELPYSYYGTIRSFMRRLPSNMRSYYTWIGLTDRANQYTYYWLSGTRQYSTSEISCYSGGSYYTCYSYERCGTFRDRSSLYAVFMDNCNDRNRFACSAPPGGARNYYSVPSLYNPPIIRSSSSNAWIWGAVAGSLFVFGLIVVGIYTVNRQRVQRLMMAQGATSVVVSSGQVTVPPPSGSYPTQPPQYPTHQPYPVQGQLYPQYSTEPPSYEAASRAAGAGGQVNPGFNK